MDSINNRSLLAVEVLGAIAAIAIPALAAVPLVSIATREVMHALYKERADRAEQVAQTELRSLGGYDRAAADPSSYVAKAMRFYQSAMQGAGHANLRILARLVVGRERQPFMPADEFLSYAPLLESLRFKELVVIAEMLKHHTLSRQNSTHQFSAWGLDYDSVVPLFFDNKDELNATITGLTRTGFVVNNYGMDGGTWSVTPVLLALEKTIEFQFIVSDESARRDGCAAV